MTVVLLVAFLIAGGPDPSGGPAEMSGDASGQVATRVTDVGGEWEWLGQRRADETDRGGPVRQQGPSQVQYRSIALCSETAGEGYPHGQCRGSYCPGGGDPWRTVVTAAAAGVPVDLGVECRLTNPAAAGPTLVSTPDLQREFATKLIHRPTLHLQPDPTATPAQVALVNGPVTATVAPYDPAAAELHVTVPVPATIRATPTTTVDWGDGTTSTGTGALTHTYRHRGTVTITAATTWQGTWWPDAAPGATTALTPIALTTTQTLEVHEAHSSLVAP